MFRFFYSKDPNDKYLQKNSGVMTTAAVAATQDRNKKKAKKAEWPE